MYFVIAFAIVLALIVVALLIPRDASYEIWPHWRRLKKPVGHDEGEDEPA